MTRPAGGTRRAGENPLGTWREIVERHESEARAALGLSPTEVARPRDLVNEVIRLADPHAVPGRDAVIPGGREDLARKWLLARLSGATGTKEERLALARQLAPDPGDNHPYLRRFRRFWVFGTASQFQADVGRAATEQFRGQPPFPD